MDPRVAANRALWDEWAPIHVRSAFYDVEAHPFAWVFDDDDAATELRLAYHYWPSPEPLVFTGGESYADPDVPVSEQHEYAWQHSMGEIVTSLAAAGLRIEYLHEHPWVPWKMFPSWSRPTPDRASGGCRSLTTPGCRCSTRSRRRSRRVDVWGSGSTLGPEPGRPRRVR
jgi:hypothetical protein